MRTRRCELYFFVCIGALFLDVHHRNRSWYAWNVCGFYLILVSDQVFKSCGIDCTMLYVHMCTGMLFIKLVMAHFEQGRTGDRRREVCSRCPTCCNDIAVHGIHGANVLVLPCFAGVYEVELYIEFMGVNDNLHECRSSSNPQSICKFSLPRWEKYRQNGSRFTPARAAYRYTVNAISIFNFSKCCCLMLMLRRVLQLHCRTRFSESFEMNMAKPERLSAL